VGRHKESAGEAIVAGTCVGVLNEDGGGGGGGGGNVWAGAQWKIKKLFIYVQMKIIIYGFSKYILFVYTYVGMEGGGDRSCIYICVLCMDSPHVCI
jgi:hypothetical protein